MSIEYLGLSKINGPLVVLEGVQNASFEEIVEITVDGKEKKLGRIVELYEVLSYRSSTGLCRSTARQACSYLVISVLIIVNYFERG